MTGSTYLLQRAMLRDAARANATGQMPATDEAVARHAATESAAHADAVRHDNAMRLDQRRFLSNLLASYDQLSAWRKENDIKTLMAAATIPVQAAGMVKQMDSLDQQAAVQKDLLDLERKKVSLTEAANQSIRETLDTASPDAAYFQPNDAPTLITNFRRPVR